VDDLDRDGLLGPDINYIHGNMLSEQEFGLVATSGGSMSITRPPTC